jgi:hypothetical protein
MGNMENCLLHNKLDNSIGQPHNINKIGGNVFLAEIGDASMGRGNFSGAYDFDGNDTVRDITLQLPNTAHTIEWWQYDTGSSAIRRWVSTSNGAATANSFIIREDGSGGVWIYTGTFPALFLQIAGIAASSKNKWVHWAVTFDGSVLKLYLDGSLQGTSPSGSMTVRTTGLYLAGRNGSGEYAVIKQSNIKVFDYAKTSFHDRFDEGFGASQFLMTG